MYFFFKKNYLKYFSNRKLNIIVSFIPYLNLNFQNFMSSSYFIPEKISSKKIFENHLIKNFKQVEINKIHFLKTHSECMVLLKYLQARRDKFDFDHTNSNWGFSYYLKSIINRDKIYPNYRKIFDKSDLITEEINLNIYNKQTFIDKINSLTKVKKLKIEEQIKDLNDNFLNKYLKENEIKLIKSHYD